MANSEITRWNERAKAISGVFFQLGSALGAAGIVKIYVDRALSWEPLVWIFLAGALIWIGWKWLGLLETDDRA